MQVQGLQQQLAAARLQGATAAAQSPEAVSGLSTAASTPAKAGSQVSGQASEATSGQPQQQEASQKDLQIAEFKQRLVKAKRQLVSWKQQVADATAAREEALGQLKGAQAQLAQQQEAAPDANVEGLHAQLAEVSAARDAAVSALQAAQAQQAGCLGPEEAAKLQRQLADAAAARAEAEARLTAAESDWERKHQHAEAAASEAQQQLEAAMSVKAAAISKAQEAEGKLAQLRGHMLDTDAADVNAGVAKVGCCVLLDLLLVPQCLSARGSSCCSMCGSCCTASPTAWFCVAHIPTVSPSKRQPVHTSTEYNRLHAAS